MLKKPLIIFDLDGTLVQSDIDYMGIRDELRLILKNLIEEDEYRQIQSTIYTILELVEIIDKKDATGNLFENAWSLVEEYEMKGYEKAFLSQNTHETLRKLKKLGHTIVIYTNNSRKLTDYALEKFELESYLDFVLTRDEVENCKPDPEGLFFIMEKFNKKIANTIFIGDSWVDAETAINAKMEFVYLGTEGAPGTRRKKIEADYIIKNIEDILEIV
ncbi:MAG: HAD family hydrolase [Candidatus Heimdallarchaeota archaeon]|nr:HAD family hydrolase [Candidatus Heimdallarchaeota archaeon]MCK4878560.1 HAD family hydrolase [Candidatus Heimdallarchaeota archaeon]